MLRMFEVKQKSSQSSEVYKSLARTYGNYRTRNYEGYRQIIRDGYLSNFIVFRCLSEIQKAARKIEFKVHKRTKDKDEVIENHPVEMLLSQPNKMYYGSELKNRALLFYYIAGEAPMEFLGNTFNNHLYVYRPDKIRYSFTGDESNPYTDVAYEGSAYTKIEPDNFFVWKNYNPIDDLDGLGHGISQLRPIFDKIDQYSSLNKWNLSLLENGGSLSGVFSIEEILGDAEYDRAKKQIKETYEGHRNVGKYALLEGGAKFLETSRTPKDMDHIEMEKSIIKAVHSNLGVDPIITGYNEFSSYNNKLEASKDLYNKTVIPVMRDMADTFNMYFSNKNLIKKEEFIGLDTSNVIELQKDKKEIVDRIEKSKFLTENEKRQELGKPEIDGLDIISGNNYIFTVKDKKLYMPINLVEAGQSASDGLKSDENFYY